MQDLSGEVHMQHHKHAKALVNCNVNSDGDFREILDLMLN